MVYCVLYIYIYNQHTLWYPIGKSHFPFLRPRSDTAHPHVPPADAPPSPPSPELPPRAAASVSPHANERWPRHKSTGRCWRWGTCGFVYDFLPIEHGDLAIGNGDSIGKVATTMGFNGISSTTMLNIMEILMVIQFNGIYPLVNIEETMERSIMLFSRENLRFRLGHFQVRKLWMFTRPGNYFDGFKDDWVDDFLVILDGCFMDLRAIWLDFWDFMGTLFMDLRIW